MPDCDDLYTAAARAVLAEFGVPSDATLTLLANGHNYVFRVDSGMKRSVLRFQSLDNFSDDTLLLQLEWLDAIPRQTRLRVPSPIPTTTGQWFVRTTVGANETPRRCVLLDWVEGEPIQTSAAFVTSDVLERVGEKVAVLHQHAARFRSLRSGSAREIDAEFLVGSSSCLGDGSAERLFAPREHAVLTAVAPKIAAAMNVVRRIDGQIGLIHGDLAPDNWVFFDGEPCPIDFDEFGRGFYLLDLLTVLWSHVSWEEYPAFRASLFAGYERVLPLAPEVKQFADVFQAATLFAWLTHGCHHHKGVDLDEFLKWVPPTTRTIARLCKS